MKHYAMTVMLLDDRDVIQRYREHHRHVWPECIEALRRVGVHEMRIFLLGRRLFMYIETADDFDPDSGFAKSDEIPRCRQWGELMRTMMEPPPEAPEAASWAPMEAIFDLNPTT